MNCSVHANAEAVGACVGCGKAVCQVCLNKKDGKMYCDSCAAKPTTDKNKIVAALLAFFLGGFGAHKFYLGQTGMGIVYLLATFLGAFLFFLGPIVIGIISFVEFIMFLVMSDEKFAEKYGKVK